MRDLAQFDNLIPAQEAGIAVQIKGPDGEPLGFSITVAGPDSNRQKAAQRKQVDARLRRRNASPMTAEEITAAGLDVTAAATLKWDAFELDGSIFPCTEENAKALYTRFPFIREQVEAAAGNRADFLSSSPKPARKQSETSPKD